MDIPFSRELADFYPDLISYKIEMDYEKLKPTDITRYILSVFNDKELTIDILYHLISNLHDHFCAFDYNKISDISGYNIKYELQEAKELFKDQEDVQRVEVRL